MTYYPVIIPTCNRYEHLKACVESLSACTHADKTELVISLDYPPSEKYIEGWKKIKAYLPTITGFGKVTIFEQKQNLGFGKNGNFSFLVNYVSKYYDAYIESEDDNVFSPCFLDYMDKCLDKYKNDESVLFICGCLEPELRSILQKAEGGNTVFKVIGNASAYGSGSWIAKNLNMEKKFPNHFKQYIFSSRFRIFKMLKCPSKLNHIYFWIKRDPNLDCVCDFTKNAWMVLNNQTNVLPAISLVRNIGFDGTGLHCGNSASEQEQWQRMQISEEKEYEIVDRYKKREINKMSKKLFKNYPKNELKTILPIIFLYLFFGYRLTELIINKCHELKKEKRIYSFRIDEVI